MIVKQFFSKSGSLYFPEILREIIGSLKGQKLAEFLRKIVTFEENSENSSQFKFLGLLKKTNLLTCFFTPKWCTILFFLIFQSCMSGKNFVFQLFRKMLSTYQGSVITNITGTNQLVSFG